MGGYSPTWTQEEKDRVREMVAAGHNSEVIAQALGRTRKGIIVSVSRYKLGPWPSLEKKDMPEGFAEDAVWMGIRRLSEKYHLGLGSIERFRAELGITKVTRKKKDPSERKPRAPAKPRTKPRPSRAKKVAKEAFVRQAQEPRKTYLKEKYKTAPIDFGTRDTSPAGEAQAYLQREGYRPVARCDENRVATATGKFWICGNVHGVLTDAQLIERVTEIRERRERMAARWAA